MTHLIVCASYLFVFMSNSLDKTNTVTTQKKIISKAVLAARYVHVTSSFKKKGQNIISASILIVKITFSLAFTLEQNAQVKPPSPFFFLFFANAKLVNNK